ncbi:MAG: DNA polymerase I [Actinomycetota bacterium]|nr:DNA polymerase I [Actinomycetota bacterium]
MAAQRQDRDTLETRDRLLLLDGHSLAYRAFFALPVENFSTTTGQPTNAVYGFTAMLINVLRDEQPTHIAVTFDVSKSTFRNEAYAEYKAGRTSAPDAFRGQVSLVREVLDALRIPIVTAEGYEADDVIATLATQAASDGMDVLVVTGDRDAFQLVDDRVTVLYNSRGVSDMKRMTPEAVREKYGLSPEQYPEFAALRGDPSDNLPGIPGLGEKTATKLIQQYGDVASLVDHVDEVKGKVGDNLRAGLAAVVRNRQLTELVRDVPLEVRPQELRLGQWDRDQVHEVFDALQFRVLRERLYATLSAVEPEAEHGFEVAARVLRPGEVRAFLAGLPAGVRVGLHVRGVFARGSGDVHGVGVACVTPEAGQEEQSPPEGERDDDAAYVDLLATTADDDDALAAWLADAAVAKALHDAKGPLNGLRARGFELAGVTSDTALAAYLALPGQGVFDLADLALRYLRRELRAEPRTDGQLTMDGALFSDDGGEQDEAAADAVLRARAVADLAVALDRDLERRGGTRLLRDVELPLVQVLADAERTGIAADVDHLQALETRLREQVKLAAEAAYETVGHEFHLGSPKQLQQLLFEELGLPKTKKIKTGYTTDADALQNLLGTHPVIEALLQHREITRLLMVVEKQLLPTVAEDSRIHTTFKQMVAATGRLSSDNPNLQNVPIRTQQGREIRQGFVAGPGFEALMTADYSQIEMRIMAHLSGDEGLKQAFLSGEDLHTFVASRAFGVPVEQVDPELRRRVKAMSYGLAYGLSAYGLATQLRIPTDEAKEQMAAYFERFGGIRDYLSDVVDQARKDGYTSTVLDRRRYLPDLLSDNGQRRAMAERMALNAPIQGSAADVIKLAMLGVSRALREEGLRSRLLLQVHDELVLEVADGERDALEGLVRREMGSAYPLDVALDVSVGVGRTWDEAGH